MSFAGESPVQLFFGELLSVAVGMVAVAALMRNGWARAVLGEGVWVLAWTMVTLSTLGSLAWVLFVTFLISTLDLSALD